MSKPTMMIGAKYEVIAEEHICFKWKGVLVSADSQAKYCRLDFGHNVSGVFEFADQRLELVEKYTS